MFAICFSVLRLEKGENGSELRVAWSLPFLEFNLPTSASVLPRYFRSAADAPPERLIGAHWRKLLASSVFSIGFRRNSWTCNHFFRNSVRAGR
ncbi:unnamed protein product [Lactuca virosa]|uniref:Secreted protein n=1 Tax=Lactuca virosa TaxID=75947 RepID=A0AAU9PEP1_9ASTR|nr:unnamed protein product [Lactuca virosa]